MFKSAKVFVFALLVCPSAWADDDWSEHYHDHYVEHIYVPETVVEYVEVQPYYPPPPPPSYEYYDQRSPQGLVGGMLGSALGYELGGGAPLAAGFGAVAGSWLGNGGYR